MAALTLPEAAKRTQNPMLRGVIKEIATTDELANVIPMEGVGTTEWKYNREGTLPETAFIDDGGQTTENSTGTDNAVNVPVRRIVGNMDVDNLANDLEDAGGVTHRANQLSKKLKATWRLVKDTIVNGGNTTSHTFSNGAPASSGAVTAIAYGPWLDSARFGGGMLKYTHTGTLWQFRAPGDRDFGATVAAASDGTYRLYSWNKSRYIDVTLTVATAVANSEWNVYFASNNYKFDGLNRVLSPDMLLTSTGANGDAFSLAKLDRLLTLEKIRVNQAFIMPGLLIEKFYAATRTLGGSDPMHMALPGYIGRKVPTYRGIPILRNDNILTTESKGGSSTLSSVYLASLDANEGLCMGVANRGGQAFNVLADPRNTTVMGFRIDDVGDLEGYDHKRTRVKWYGALGLKSSLALARASEIETA